MRTTLDKSGNSGIIRTLRLVKETQADESPVLLKECLGWLMKPEILKKLQMGLDKPEKSGIIMTQAEQVVKHERGEAGGSPMLLEEIRDEGSSWILRVF